MNNTAKAAMAMSVDNTDSWLSWEVFFLGGCSMIVCLALWGCTDKSMSVMTMSQLAFGLAFAVNHPHFLSSYVLLYRDFRANIFTRFRYLWAAVIVPVALAAYMIYGFAAGRVDLIGHGLNAMFFLVGWHYVKQVFGCIIVTSARRKLFYGKWERRIILSNLFSIWATSFVEGQMGGPSFTFYGIVYPGLGLSHILPNIAMICTAITGAAMIGMFFRKYVNDGVKPSPPGMAALGALYVWYLPAFSHPAFAYLIPLFHSMQYLAFVWSFKTNQVADQIHKLEGREWRAAWVRDFVGYAVMVTILGAMAFEFVPRFLDSQKLLNNPALGTSPMMAFFLMFINIHHYFIDNVIWKSSNEEVKKYLFKPQQPAVAQGSQRGKMAA